MKMLYFSVTLMVALVCATAYLALQARDEAIKANTKMDLLTSQQRAIAAQQSVEVQLPPPAFEKAPEPAAPAKPKITPPLAPAPVVVAENTAPASRPAGSPTPPPAPPTTPIVVPPMPKLVAVTPPPLPLVPTKPAMAKAGSAIVLEDEPAVPVSGAAPLTPAQRLVKSAPSIAKLKEFVPDQGFVVLSSGTKQGIAAGLKFDIRRDSSIVGRIKITSADETESVADIDLKSVPAGVTLREGDEVIGVVLTH